MNTLTVDSRPFIRWNNDSLQYYDQLLGALLLHSMTGKRKIEVGRGDEER